LKGTFTMLFEMQHT